MKRILSGVLAFALILLMLPLDLLFVRVHAASTSNFTFTLNSDGSSYSVRCNSSASGSLVIPSTYNGKPVTRIANHAFQSCNALTAVTIPSGISSIGDCAFRSCHNLKSITIPDSVTSIGEDAFCYSGLSSVTIPDSVTRIGSGAFYECDSLTTAYIGTSVIGSTAFFGCDSLISVTISDSVTSIGGDAFFLCDSLASVYITDLAAWCRIGFGNECANPLYYAQNLYVNGVLTTDISIPNGVTSIGRYAFGNCNLTSVTIPDSVASIGEDAFILCDSLASVYITDLAAWCRISFDNECANPLCYAQNLYVNGALATDISIPNGVTRIGRYAFYNYTNLTSVSIPDSVTIIREAAFYMCNSLKSVNYLGYRSDYRKMVIEGSNWSLTFADWNYATCANDHSFDGACDRICNICEATRTGEPHKYDNSCDTTCNVCGDIRYIYHTYDNDCDTECNVCGNFRITQHNYEWIVDEENTCTTDGIKHEECVDCHVIQNEGTVIPASGEHNYDDVCDTECNTCGADRIAPHNYAWIINKENNCGTIGSKHEECTLCHIKRNIGTVIPATGNHVYDNACDPECNTCQHRRAVGAHEYTINNGVTCAICKYSKAPAAPSILALTADSLTLVSQEGMEYSIDGVTWQDSPTFNNLVQGKRYSFYQRVKAAANALVSESSAALEVNFTTKTIQYDANGGQNAPAGQTALVSTTTTLSASKAKRTGYRFVGWATKESCGKQYAPGEELLVVEDVTFYALWIEECSACHGDGVITVGHDCFCDNGKEFVTRSKCRTCGGIDCIGRLWGVVQGVYGYWDVCDKCKDVGSGYLYEEIVTHSDCNGTGRRYTDENCTACNCSGIVESTIPAPKVSAFTDTVVTLSPYPGYEYSADGINWQTSNVFENLSPATSYRFYCRKGATAEAPFGLPSNSVSVRTDKSIQTQIPSSPIAESVTSSSITLFAVDGCEYSKDGTTWQASPSFTGLSVATKYTFYQRYKATSTTYAGKASEALVAKTDKGTQSQPSQPTLSSKNHKKVVLRSVYGCEYSKDGINWQSSPEFTELAPSTNYYFYIRKAETDSYYASNMSTALIVRTDDLPTYTLGDLDGDGELSDWDGVMLARYLAGWDVEVEPATLDIDGDGEVTDWDGVILDRYLAGWNITIG